MRDATYHTNTKAHMVKLSTAMRAKLRNDACGDYFIEGRRGNIHADGTGYGIAVMLSTSRQWTAAKEKLLRFCELLQDGDAEGVMHMAALPTAVQASLLRKALKIPKTFSFTQEALERKRKAMRIARKALTAKPRLEPETIILSET